MSDGREGLEFLMLLFLIVLMVLVFLICWLVVDYYTRQFVELLDSAIGVSRSYEVGFIR